MKKLLGLAGAFVALVAVILSGITVIVVDFSNHPDLDTYLEEKMVALEARGMAVAFIEDGQVSWSRNYGYADVEASKRVTDQTISRSLRSPSLSRASRSCSWSNKGCLTLMYRSINTCPSIS